MISCLMCPQVLLKGDDRLADVISQYAISAAADLLVTGSQNLCVDGEWGQAPGCIMGVALQPNCDHRSSAAGCTHQANRAATRLTANKCSSCWHNQMKARWAI
jgi:hypothetical protein